MPKDPQVDSVITGLDDISLANKLDFTVKSPLTDATFVIEGRKIYAGRDFLSIHSPFFNALLKGGYAESNQEEIELKDVAYEEFLGLLEYLVNPSKEIKAENVQSLLILADRFDIKYLIDRAEIYFLSNCDFSVSEKLLMADRYRMMKLQTTCVDYISRPNQQTMREIVTSEEFRNLSAAAKKALFAVKDMTACLDGRPNPNYIHQKRFLHLPRLPCVHNLKEPSDGFIASSKITIYGYDMRQCTLAGLFWGVCDYGGLNLYVNADRPSSVEWSVEGFVELTVVKFSTLDGPAKELLRLLSKWSFSFNNDNRAGRMCYVEPYDFYYFGYTTKHVTFHVTRILGVRQYPSVDFTSPTDLSNAVFIVEGKKVHVNKQYLSTISPRFNEMLTENDEVELKNVEYKDFIEFLHWVYPSSRRDLSVPSIFNFMKIGQQFEVEMAKFMNMPGMAKYYAYENLRSSYVSLAAQLIFFFQFDYGSKDLLTDVLTDEEQPMRGFAAYACEQLKKSDLLAKMTPEKKEAMLQFVKDTRPAYLDEPYDD